MSIKGKPYNTIKDSQEQIEMCLACKRNDCVDCIGRHRESEKYQKKYADREPPVNIYVDALDAKVLNLYLTATCDREISELTSIPLRSVTTIRHKFNLPPIRGVSVEKRKQLVDKWLKKGA